MVELADTRGFSRLSQESPETTPRSNERAGSTPARATLNQTSVPITQNQADRADSKGITTKHRGERPA
jgi:hypothetical protein